MSVTCSLMVLSNILNSTRDIRYILKELNLINMKRISTYIAIVGIFALSALTLSAQDRHKIEFFGGYQFNNLSTGLGELNDEIGEDIFDNRVTAHGWNMSLTGNVNKLIGLKFDYSTTGRAIENPFDIDLKYRQNQFLGGIQLKNNEKDGPRFKPFVHVLAGIANQRIRCAGECDIDIAEGTVTSDFSESNNSFSMVFGGGLDVKVHPRIDIRLIQLDYNPVFFGGNQNLDLEGRTQNNFRIGFGIVIH